MMFFARSEIVVRCAFRGAALSVPHGERLLACCAGAARRQLRRRLGRIAWDDRLWSLSWARQPGDRLAANARVAVLQLDGIVVELLCARGGVLSEISAADEVRVREGDRLATISRPEQPSLPVEDAGRHLLRQFVLRHRRAAEEIRRLRQELSEKEELLGRLRIAAPPSDPKFARLKREFSRHFHPDGPAADAAERRRRAEVFREFWPIVQEIDRS